MPLLQMQNIVKQYPGVRALDAVTFELETGEIHCLIGENGAGKSTLVKILSGAILRDGGQIKIDNSDVAIHSPASSQHLGIGIIYQDFKLVPELTVAENILLGNEPLYKKLPFIEFSQMYETSRTLISQLGEEIDPAAPVRTLTIAQRQMVEIAKALSRKVRILVMDEPTASLSERETENLFQVIRTLRSQGVSVVYISHRLEEIFKIADRITVLRDGKVVTTCTAAEVDTRNLIRWMVGREMENEFPGTEHVGGKEILRLENISNDRLQKINVSLRQGEILGVSGLVGAGRSDLARVIFGTDKIGSGRMFLEDKEIHLHSPQEAIRAGIGLLTEDRNHQGLFLQRNVRENISISNLRELSRGIFINQKKERQTTQHYIELLHVKPTDPEANLETLSGGNRQKVILARWLFTKSKVLIFDEPTVGIDVGVKYEIYTIILQLAQQGVAILMISSEIPELLGICDRIAVMCTGRITGILSRSEATKEKILGLATKFN